MSDRPLRVLLVDDNEDDILLAREALNSCRMLTLTRVARDGVEALEYLRATTTSAREARPELVLMDINMPSMGGFETLRAMKQDPRLRSIPVILTTVSQREEDVVRAYEDGAVTYVCKPLAFEDLVATLRRIAEYWTQVARCPGQIG